MRDRLATSLVRLSPSQRLVTVLLLASLVASFAVPDFATPLNISQLLTQMSINGVMVVGMTILLIAGGVDLSVGSTLAMSGVVYAMASSYGALPALVLATLAGTFVGIANGVLVVRGKINFFIATLATMVAVQGVGLTLSSGQTIAGTTPDFTWLGNAGISVGPFELQIPAIVFIAAIIAGTIVLGWTQLGRNFYALGGNRQASYLAGVRTDRTFFAAFVIMGALAGLAGALLASRTSSGSPAIGGDTALVVIAASVLGGTSVYGGIGSVLGSVVGLVALSVLDNVLLLSAVPSFYDFIIRGSLLIVVVVVDAQVSAHRRSHTQLAPPPDAAVGAVAAGQ